MDLYKKILELDSVYEGEGQQPVSFETNNPNEAIKEIVRRFFPGVTAQVPISENLQLNIGPGVNEISAGGQFDVGGGELSIGGGMRGDDKAFGIGFRYPFDNGGLSEEYYGKSQLAYQKAVKDGFQGTYEEYLRLISPTKSFADGGMLVKSSADESRPGYKGALRIEPNITKTKAGNYEVIYKNKQIGTFNKLSDAREARKTAIANDPAKLRTEKLFGGKISFNSVVEKIMDDLVEEGYESFSTADVKLRLSRKIKKDYNVTNAKILNSIQTNRKLDKFKDLEFKKGTGLNQVKPLTKAKQLILETSFPEIDFDFTTGRKYGIDKASDPIRYRKIKDFITMPSEGLFPYGYQAKEGLWNSLYRSTISGDRWELISKVPKNWKKDGAWKKAKFRDTQTGDIITYNNLKEYVDSQGGKGTYENSLKSWDNKRALSKIKIMYQGKEQSLGGVLNKVALAKSKKKPPVGMKNLPGFATFQIAHTKGVGNNFWDVEVAYRNANLQL